MSDVTEPARDPESILAEAAALTARTSDLDTALAGLLQLAVDAADATDAVVFLQDPDRPELQLAGSTGIAADAVERLAIEVRDAGHPVNVVAGSGTADPAAGLVSLVVETSGVEVILGVLKLSRDGSPADVGSPAVRAAADLIAVAVELARLAATATERSDWFERIR